MKIFNAESIDLRHFNPITVVYPPKGTHIQALRVTDLNVGALSIEFETELLYSGDWGHYFVITAERGVLEDQIEKIRRVLFKIGDWIVPLRGELHNYPDEIFQNTFQFIPSAKPFSVPKDWVDNSIAIAPGTDFSPGGQGWEGSARNAEMIRDAAQPTGGQTQYQDGSFEAEYNVDDRVYLVSEDQYGVVTVVNVELIGDKGLGVEVRLRTGEYRTVKPEELLHAAVHEKKDAVALWNETAVKYRVNDRIYLPSEDRYGIVTVLGRELEHGRGQGLEILLEGPHTEQDDGYRDVKPDEIEHRAEISGNLTGPHDTSIMPRVEG